MSKEKLKSYYEDLFPWLEKCEKIFDPSKLGGYDVRICAFLAERFMSYWFQKNTKYGVEKKTIKDGWISVSYKHYLALKYIVENSIDLAFIMEDNVGKINEKNFLTNDEKILNDSLSENNKAEKSYHGHYTYYYIRKKDFNIEKWWLGWNSEED